MTKRSVTKKPKLTKWFDGAVKPVRNGIYQRSHNQSDWGLFWLYKNGEWKYGGEGSPHLVRDNNCPSPQQEMSWRGLAQNPEVKP